MTLIRKQNNKTKQKKNTNYKVYKLKNKPHFNIQEALNFLLDFSSNER